MSGEFDLDGIDVEEIRELMDLLARSDVTECEIEQGETSLSVRRKLRDHPIAERSSQTGDEGYRDESALVQASAVGVYYHGETRSGVPRVDIGTRIKAGDILGRIEVMGIPHSVFSTYDGVVESFLVEDGQPVEYGQPLVSVRL